MSQFDRIVLHYAIRQTSVATNLLVHGSVRLSELILVGLANLRSEGIPDALSVLLRLRHRFTVILINESPEVVPFSA